MYMYMPDRGTVHAHDQCVHNITDTSDSVTSNFHQMTRYTRVPLFLFSLSLSLSLSLPPPPPSLAHSRFLLRSVSILFFVAFSILFSN
jgi:hypothetical protein